MKSTITLSVTKKEMDAAMNYQKAIYNTLNKFGVKSRGLSSMDKTKIFFGGTKRLANTVCKNGIELSYDIKISKKGITVEITYNVAEIATVEILSAYTDILNIYVPALEIVATTFKLTSKDASKRMLEAEDVLREL